MRETILKNLNFIVKVFLLIGAVIIISCNKSKTNNQGSIIDNQYYNPYLNFTISFPIDWKLTMGSNNNLLVEATNEEEIGIKVYVEEINFDGDIDEWLNVDDWAELILRRDSLTRLISKDKLMINHRSAFAMKYYYPSNFHQKANKIFYAVSFTGGGKFIYTIISEINFLKPNNRFKIVDKIIQSIEVKDLTREGKTTLKSIENKNFVNTDSIYRSLKNGFKFNYSLSEIKSSVYRIGSTELQIPWPDEFVQEDTIIASEVIKMAQLVSPDEARLLGLFSRKAQLDNGVYDKFMCLFTPRKFENRKINRSDFRKITSLISERQASIYDSVKLKMFMDSLSSRVAAKRNLNFQVEVKDQKSIGIIYESPNCISYQTITVYNFEVDGKQKEFTNVGCTSFILYNSKLLFAYTISSLNDEHDINWTRNKHLDWIKLIEKYL